MSKEFITTIREGRYWEGEIDPQWVSQNRHHSLQAAIYFRNFRMIETILNHPCVGNWYVRLPSLLNSLFGFHSTRVNMNVELEKKILNLLLFYFNSAGLDPFSIVRNFEACLKYKLYNFCEKIFLTHVEEEEESESEYGGKEAESEDEESEGEEGEGEEGEGEEGEGEEGEGEEGEDEEGEDEEREYTPDVCNKLFDMAVAAEAAGFFLGLCYQHREGKINLGRWFYIDKYQKTHLLSRSLIPMFELMIDDYMKFFDIEEVEGDEEDDELVQADYFVRDYFLKNMSREWFKKLFAIGKVYFVEQRMIYVCITDVLYFRESCSDQFFILNGILNERRFEYLSRDLRWASIFEQHCKNLEILDYFLDHIDFRLTNFNSNEFMISPSYNITFGANVRDDIGFYYTIFNKLTDHQFLRLLMYFFYEHLSFSMFPSNIKVILDYLITKRPHIELEKVQAFSFNPTRFWKTMMQIYNEMNIRGLRDEKTTMLELIFRFYDLGWPGLHRSYYAFFDLMTNLCGNREGLDDNDRKLIRWFYDHLAFPKEPIVFNLDCPHVLRDGSLLKSHPAYQIHQDLLELTRQGHLISKTRTYDEMSVSLLKPAPNFTDYTVSGGELLNMFRVLTRYNMNVNESDGRCAFEHWILAFMLSLNIVGDRWEWDGEGDVLRFLIMEMRFSVGEEFLDLDFYQRMCEADERTEETHNHHLFLIKLFKFGWRLSRITQIRSPRVYSALIFLKGWGLRKLVKQYLYSPWGRYAIEHLELVKEGGEVDEEARVALRERRNQLVERLLELETLDLDSLLSQQYYLPDGSGFFDVIGDGAMPRLRQLLYRLPTAYLEEMVHG